MGKKTSIKVENTKEDLFYDIIHYCNDRFGPRRRRTSDNKTRKCWAAARTAAHVTVSFHDPKHAVVFALRWGDATC